MSSTLNRRERRPDDQDMAEKATVADKGITATGRAIAQRRRHPRVNVKGGVRLVADTCDGLVTVTGRVVDLSISGCAMRVFTQLEPDREARIELTIDGERVWVPGHIVWIRIRDGAWTVGVKFDRLVPEKQSLVTRLVAERRAHRLY
jgi:c-di-GMP-binding flagellar brake protein YcgR